MSRAVVLALGCAGCRIGFTEQTVSVSDAAVDAPTDLAPGIVTRTFGERPGSMTSGVTTDATLDQSAPTQNFGPTDDLSIAGAAGFIERGAIRFDLSSLVSGTVVVASRLELAIVDFGDQMAGAIVLNTIGQPWVESAATWTNRDTGVAWTVVGGTVAGAFMTIGLPAVAVVITIPPSLIEGWIDAPATNFGLAVQVADEATTTHYHVHSSESTVLSGRPMLVLDLQE